VKNHSKVIKNAIFKDAKACEKGINSTMKKFKSNLNAASPKKDSDKKYNQNKRKKNKFPRSSYWIHTKDIQSTRSVENNMPRYFLKNFDLDILKI
jgi:predicted transposase YbfD/YdcC